MHVMCKRIFKVKYLLEDLADEINFYAGSTYLVVLIKLWNCVRVCGLFVLALTKENVKKWSFLNLLANKKFPSEHLKASAKEGKILLVFIRNAMGKSKKTSLFFIFSWSSYRIIIHLYRHNNSSEILLMNQLKFDTEQIWSATRLLARENNSQQRSCCCTSNLLDSKLRLIYQQNF